MNLLVNPRECRTYTKGREISRRLLLRACRKFAVAEIAADRERCLLEDAARVAEIAVEMNVEEIRVAIKARGAMGVRVRTIARGSSCSRVQMQNERRESKPAALLLWRTILTRHPCHYL